MDFQNGDVSALQTSFDTKRLMAKEVNGNSDVPVKGEENKELGNWVSQQRQSYNRGSLHPMRVKLLEEAGSSWRRGTQKWQERYSALLLFKSRTGNCDVPTRLSRRSRSWCMGGEPTAP